MSDLIGDLELLDVGKIGYLLAAIAHGLFALYLLLAWRGGRFGAALLGAVLGGALWSIGAYLALASGRLWVFVAAGLLDVLRIGAWYACLLVLLELSGSDRVLIRRLATVAVIAAIALAVFQVPFEPEVWAARGVMLCSLLAAVYGLVLVEQLIRNLPPDSRWGVKPMAIGLVAAFAFDVYLYAEGLMFQRVDGAVWAVRGFVNALILPLVALTVARNPEWKIHISVSRQVVFHSSALLASGAYLLLVAGAGYYLRFFGGDWGRAFQVALVFAGLLGLVLVAVSGSLRARFRVWLSKHLFAYKYDYRNEWLGFTQALAGSSGQRSPKEAVIKALADLVESPGGGIWLREAGEVLRFQGRLNMAECDADEPADGPLASFLGDSGWIVNLAEYRSRRELYRGLALPAWLSRLESAWLVVPLICNGDLVGFVVLLSPRTQMEVDWEVLDLLKTAQHQAASYLSQLQAQEALLEAKKFDAFNRMSAFVVHDLKNLVAQLSLLMKNAERHRDNPEFQQDVLDTVAHVETRMRALMAQLLEKTPIDPRRAVDLGALVSRIVAGKARQKPAPQLTETAGVTVLAHADRLERILGHIVQNAMDATADDGKVTIRVGRVESGHALVTVSDSGCGMSAEFVRDGLFRPFQSTKPSGMGIGAYESRQYLQEIGGSIEVTSEPGVGTEMRILLPLCAGDGGAVEVSRAN
ncbi:MAG: PEP-CTERM system histidine kinase PrsK [Rhodocyclaceae bacterium]|nr:PEP-CTERM system histidine kinase PrsK [Rhodocyclaceae bacterium]